MAKGTNGVQFGSPKRGKEASARSAPGRTCEYPGCSTVLSTYNSTNTCWAHEPRSYRRTFERE